MSVFLTRAVRKAREHLQHDKTGLTFLRYSLRLLSARARRRIAAGGSAPKPAFPSADPGVVRLAVSAAGGIGDYVVIARAVRDLAAQSPGVQVDVYCPFTGPGEWVFGQLPCVERVLDARWFAEALEHYDCAFCLNQYAYAEEGGLNREKLARLAPSLLRSVERCLDSRREWAPYIEQRPMRDAESARLIVASGHSRCTFLQSQLGIEPGSLVLDLATDESAADKLSARFERWVTINTGYDANLVMAADLPTKCYPTDSWTQLVRDLKQRHPDIAVVQIGAKTSVPIAGVDANLVGSTSLAQAAGVLRRALVHVDCDGGLVHIAAGLGARCVVLFGPTPWDYFGYSGNINVSSGYCGDCWWSIDGWMERCPIGHRTPKCMDDLPPSRVLDAVEDAISQPVGAAPDCAYALPQSMVADRAPR